MLDSTGVSPRPRNRVTIPCNLSSPRSRMCAPRGVSSLLILTEKDKYIQHIFKHKSISFSPRFCCCSISFTIPLVGVDMLNTRSWPYCCSSSQTSNSTAFMSMGLPQSSTRLSSLSNLFTCLGGAAKGLVGREGPAACEVSVENRSLA